MANKTYQEPLKVRKLRRNIIAGIGALLVVVGGIGIWSIFSGVPAALDAGDHYDLMTGAERPRSGPIVITEYFSYACVHCRNFDPQIESWAADLPEGVRFERVPVSFSPAWRNLARAYYALEELDLRERHHQRIFDAIHLSGLNLATPESIAQLVGGQGVDAETFRRTMQSPAVRRKIDEAERRTRESAIAGVPTVVVDDRYRISSGDLSRRQILDVADRLIEKERELRSEADTAPAS